MIIHQRAMICLVVAAALCPTMVCASPVGTSVTKKLIEFGWDEPDPAFMRQHAAEMDQSPFDGTVFHLTASSPSGAKTPFVWECWGKKTFTAAELKHGLDDLKATSFTKLRHNFLRFNVTPGNVDWFDDFTPVLTNSRLAASIARQGPCDGILLDVEHYNARLFFYGDQPSSPTRSFAEYATITRRRGREVMAAFQDGFPDLKVLLTFGCSLPFKTCQLTPTTTTLDSGRTPAEQCEYALLMPFLDGMMEEAAGKSRLVDGYEWAYGFTEANEFEAARVFIKHEVPAGVADPARYSRLFSAGFGIWLDFQSQRPEHPWYPDAPERNYFTPERFEKAVRNALAASDEYVWIYSEVPRWWSLEGKTVKLPPAYSAALTRARASANRK